MAEYSFAVTPAPAFTSAKESHLLVEKLNLFTGADDFRTAFGGLSSLEHDLLRVSSAVFAADRASPRGEREDYRRFISVRIPVTCFDAIASRTKQLERLLRRLSQDIWNISFVPLDSAQEAYQAESSLDLKPAGGKTLLFSGGLDSLAGALKYGNEAIPTLLSSHITRNPATDGAQRELVRMMESAGLKLIHKHFFVSSKDGGPSKLEHQREPSQRTRSFVFLVLGALAARRSRRSTLVSMAENGQMAIHLPLSSARIGAFSTHTAHPTVLALSQEFLRSVLNYDLTIENPYVYNTKAEVISEICASHSAMLPVSSSCWKNSRPMAGGARHCGECVPCLVRRIAVERHCPDPTLYAVDLLSADIRSLPPEHDGRRNLVDLCEFAMRFATKESDLESEFPELISDDFDQHQAIEMYRRFSVEAINVLKSRPQLAWLLG